MLRNSVLIVGLGLFAGACGGSSPTDPSSGTTTASTYTVTLSAGNEVPAVTNADAGGGGTATITLNVTRDGSGNISSATADFQINVTGFPAGTRVTDAHIHNAGAGAQRRRVRQCRPDLRRARRQQRKRSDHEERDQRSRR